MDEYEFCELRSRDDIINHELLLYDSFVNRAKHGWIYHNYIINDKKMRAPFPYKNQLVFGIKYKTKLLASVAVNMETGKKMQLEYIGFSRRKIDNTKRFAEVLTLCSTGKHTPPDTLAVVRRFNQYLKKKYRENGIIDIYGTTFIKKKFLYFRLGFIIVDHIENEYGSNLLLRQRIE